MTSIQSTILKFWIRRLNLFSVKQVDSLALRRRINALTLKAKTHRKVQLSMVDAGGVLSEWLIPQGAPTDRALMYIHGGAWFMGSTASHRAFVSDLAFGSGFRALSINYRLAPEHPFPEGLEDCIRAYEWLMENGVPSRGIVVAGDSAGGNLTLALLVALRDAGKPLPAAAVGISPATDLSKFGVTRPAQLKCDPFFAHMGPNTIIEDYITDYDPTHPMISPVYADLHDLPPILLHVGECEMLLDEVVRFGDLAAAAGVDVKTVVWPGMFHVFHMFSRFLPEARQANEQIIAFIDGVLA